MSKRPVNKTPFRGSHRVFRANNQNNGRTHSSNSSTVLPNIVTAQNNNSSTPNTVRDGLNNQTWSTATRWHQTLGSNEEVATSSSCYTEASVETARTEYSTGTVNPAVQYDSTSTTTNGLPPIQRFTRILKPIRSSEHGDLTNGNSKNSVRRVVDSTSLVLPQKPILSTQLKNQTTTGQPPSSLNARNSKPQSCKLPPIQNAQQHHNCTLNRLKAMTSTSTPTRFESMTARSIALTQSIMQINQTVERFPSINRNTFPNIPTNPMLLQMPFFTANAIVANVPSLNLAEHQSDAFYSAARRVKKNGFLKTQITQQKPQKRTLRKKKYSLWIRGVPELETIHEDEEDDVNDNNNQ